MARSSAKRQASARRPAPAAASSQPGWVWGLGGLAVGLSVALLVHLYHQDRGGVVGIEGLLPEPPADREPAAGEPSRPAPRFEFYRLLPRQEVVVPEPDPLPPREPAGDGDEQPPTQATAAGARYLLQAGSFRSGEDAERLKARLALLGIEAGIQTVELAGGETWHRVRVGPLPAGDRLNQVRARLEQNQIESILLRRGG